MFAAALSWFDRQRPLPKHAEERTLPPDAFTPPDAEAMATGRWEAPHDEPPTPAAPYEGLLATLQGDYASATAPAAPSPARIAGGYADGGPLPAREPVVAGEYDRDLAATKRQSDWPEPPDYGRPPTSVGALTVAMDREIAGSLADTRGESLALERRLRRAAEDRYAKAEAGRVEALARVAELELTVKALGEVIAHAAGHDDATDTEGGQ